MKTNSLGKDALILTSSKLITMVIGMIAAMLLSRFRTLEEYGTYSQLLMVINLVSSLLILGLPGSINYFIATAETIEEKSRFLSVYYTLSTILSMLIGTVLVLSVPYIIMYFKNPAIRGFIYFLAVFPWTRIIMSGIENILIVSKKIKLLMLYRITNSVALLFAILFVQFSKLQFRHYMILYLFIEVLFSLFVYFIVRELTSKFCISFDIRIIKSIFEFSIPIGLASMVGTISLELDKLIIGKFMDTESLALYANASKELPITIVSASITAVLMPKLVKLLHNNQNKEAITLWGDATIISYIVICFFSVAMLVFAPQVITILYSEKYLPAVNVFRVYNLVLLLRVTYFGMILNSIGKTKFIMYSSIASLILNLILNILCLKTLGFIGPAIATFLSIGLVNLLQLIFTAKLVAQPFKTILPWKSIATITLINMMSGMIIYFIINQFNIGIDFKNLVRAVILGIVWMIMYALILVKYIVKKWNKINQY